LRIISPSFTVNLSVKDGVVTAADRPVRWMIGKPLARVLRLAERWHWQIQYLNEAERKQCEDQSGDRPQQSTA
jgi:hypothetical protein